MKAFITKYALSQGIIEVDDAVPSDRFPDLITVKSLGPFASFHSGEWHKTKEDAIARSEKIRKAKIESMKRRLAFLEKIDFSKIIHKQAQT